MPGRVRSLGVVLALVVGLVASGDQALASTPTLAWNTFLGSASADYGEGIAVDGGGNVLVAGRSSSAWGAPVAPFSLFDDALVAKLGPDGTLLWHTFLGPATDYARGLGIGVDAAGNSYVVGGAFATFGVPLQAMSGVYDVFVAKLDPSGSLQWHTFLGSYGNATRPPPGGVAHAIAVDAGGSVFVAGRSDASWGTAPVRSHGGSADAFVAKLGTDGRVQWHTFLGSASFDFATGVALDAAGNVFVTGSSAATWGAPARPHAGLSDVFVAKLDPAGGLLWNSFLGSAEWDAPAGVAVGAAGGVFVTGEASVAWGSPTRSFGGYVDAFVARLDDGDGALRWNAFLGSVGPDRDLADDRGRAVAAMPDGGVCVLGDSDTPWGAPARAHAGWTDAFVAVLDGNGQLQWNTFLGGADYENGRGVAVGSGGDIAVAGKSSAPWGSPARPYAGTPDAFVALLAADPPANRPPSLSPIPDREAAEGALIEFSAVGDDPDGDAVTYDVAPLPPGASFDEVTGLFRWVPRLTQAGTYRLMFTGTDGTATSDPQAATITVTDPDGPVFFDDFSDGAAPGEWLTVSGSWSGGRGELASRSLSGTNLARISTIDPLALPLGAGVVQARIKLTPSYGQGGPNGILVFAYRDAAHHRYLKVTRTELIVGQTGAFAGVSGGAKKRVARPQSLDMSALYTLRIHPDGWVRVFKGTALAPALSYRFMAGGAPSVVEGGVGLAAVRARTVFDNVKVWEDSALATPP